MYCLPSVTLLGWEKIEPEFQSVNLCLKCIYQVVESNHSQRRDEKVPGDEGYLPNTCNQTGISSPGNQQAQVEANPKHNVEVQGTLDSFSSNHTQRRYEKVFGDDGYLTNTYNQTATASTENQQAQLQAKIKHKVELQSTLESLRSFHSQSRDEIVSGDMGDHTHEFNHTGIASRGNQLAHFEAEFKHNLGAHTTSAEDQLQNALALLYRKRQDLVIS